MLTMPTLLAKTTLTMARINNARGDGDNDGNVAKYYEIHVDGDSHDDTYRDTDDNGKNNGNTDTKARRRHIAPLIRMMLPMAMVIMQIMRRWCKWRWYDSADKESEATFNVIDGGSDDKRADGDGYDFDHDDANGHHNDDYDDGDDKHTHGDDDGDDNDYAYTDGDDGGTDTNSEKDTERNGDNDDNDAQR